MLELATMNFVHAPLPILLVVISLFGCAGGLDSPLVVDDAPDQDVALPDAGTHQDVLPTDLGDPMDHESGEEDTRYETRDTSTEPIDDVQVPSAPDTQVEDAHTGEEGVEDVHTGDEGVEDVHTDDAEDTSMSDEPDADAPLDPFRIFMAPDGDDGRDGLTTSTAILTLERAHQIIATEQPNRDVEVIVAPGRYFGQTVVWTYTMPDYSITFTRPTPESDRPVFDGCLVENPTDTRTQCPAGTWFMLRHSAGERTNLVFNYIRVERYQTAISLNGSRALESTFNSHNRIYGCYFYNIGNHFAPHLNPSTAVVRLVNSNDNSIENNHFINVINTTSPGLIHALYLAHYAHRNMISRNVFRNNSGDAVRLRDYSNGNVITANRFYKVGVTAGYSDWYCEHEHRDDCTKRNSSGDPLPECPSWDNQFRDNLLDGDYLCNPLGVWFYAQPDTAWGCSPPSPDARRVRTSGNTRPDPPCSP